MTSAGTPCQIPSRNRSLILPTPPNTVHFVTVTKYLGAQGYWNITADPPRGIVARLG